MTATTRGITLGSDTILVRQGGEMIELQPTPYANEALLQELLAKHYALLAGAQINSAQPRRWLLVTRELGIPSEFEGATRLSLDHLFLDQDAIPTLVEVKRSSDTRIRREVVGQMLDYAANGVAYLNVETLRTRFQATCEQRGENPDAVLADFVGGPDRVADFWDNVKTNLQAERIRLIFIADEIPDALARIIEFLNKQMDPAEVLGIEIRQFAGQGLETYIPRLLGQTEEAKKRKSVGRAPGREWDEESVLTLLEQRRGRDAADVARRIVAWARAKNVSIAYGSGTVDGSIIFTANSRGVPYYLMAIYSYGKLEIHFQHLKNKSPFDDEEVRRRFAEQLNRIPGFTIADASLEKRPSIDLEMLAGEPAFDRLVDALDWFLGTIESGVSA